MLAAATLWALLSTFVAPSVAPSGAPPGARAGASVLSEHGSIVSPGLDRAYYVPGLALAWVFAPRRHFQISAGADLDYALEVARLGTSVADCGDPCPRWTRSYLRVMADLKLGPAWDVAWPWVRVRAGYAHEWVDTGGDPSFDDHANRGGTVNLSTGVSFYAFGGLTFGLQVGGGALLRRGAGAGVIQLGVHAGWSFGRRD